MKKEIVELFFKSIMDNMDRFEKKEMKKTRAVKNTWCGWLISYVPDTIRKIAGGF